MAADRGTGALLANLGAPAALDRAGSRESADDFDWDMLASTVMGGVEGLLDSPSAVDDERMLGLANPAAAAAAQRLEEGEAGDRTPSQSQLGDFMDEIGLGKYCAIFAQNEMDLKTLAMCSDTDLADLGIPKVRRLCCTGQPPWPSSARRNHKLDEMTLTIGTARQDPELGKSPRCCRRDCW